jgi:hypothetical protein
MLTHLTTTDRLVIGSMLLTLSSVILGALLAEPNAFGGTAVLVILMLLACWWVTRDDRLGWLLLASLVAGVLELWADWVHVEYFKSLVYTDYFGFRLLASPSYIPVGWGLTVTQFGYLALRLGDIRPPWQSAGIIALLGMTLPSWYEEFAAPARAWHYTTGGPMFSNTPLWIIFTYSGCMLAVAVMALLLYRRRDWGRALLAGLFIGAGIMFSGVFWFSLLG